MPTLRMTKAELDELLRRPGVVVGPTLGEAMGRVAEVSADHPKRSKYGAKRVTVCGITFDSQKEARRYLELKALEAAGQIHGLELQPEYTLNAEGGGKVSVYKADFRYVEAGQIVVEDVKGFKTPAYRLKKRHMKEQYGIEIRET